MPLHSSLGQRVRLHLEIRKSQHISIYKRKNKKEMNTPRNEVLRAHNVSSVMPCPKVSTASFLDPVNVTFHGKREFEDVIS